MSKLIKWYYKAKLFVKPRIWPFCRVKDCWERNCVFGGIRVTMCSRHACEKMLEVLFPTCKECGGMATDECIRCGSPLCGVDYDCCLNHIIRTNGRCSRTELRKDEN